MYFYNTHQLLVWHLELCDWFKIITCCAGSSMIGRKSALVVPEALWLVENCHFCLQTDGSSLIGRSLAMSTSKNVKKNINWIEKPKERFVKALFCIPIEFLKSIGTLKTRSIAIDFHHFCNFDIIMKHVTTHVTSWLAFTFWIFQGPTTVHRYSFHSKCILKVGFP